MENKTFNISYFKYNNIQELSAEDRYLCEQAVVALNNSYSPYSNFKVGTAVRLQDNTIELGSNQENVAYPSGLCAERVALFSIGAKNPEAVIKAMAITAQTAQFSIENPVTSCGACLQVMAEVEKKQGSPIEVLFYCIGGEIIKVTSILSLLPFAFFENRLEKSV
ncbi:MAG: cytidine deaminase [Pedobacter sp.]|nr:MAG: cytidine deaminase [Pedobacter sp.]